LIGKLIELKPKIVHSPAILKKKRSYKPYIEEEKKKEDFLENSESLKILNRKKQFSFS